MPLNYEYLDKYTVVLSMTNDTSVKASVCIENLTSILAFEGELDQSTKSELEIAVVPIQLSDPVQLFVTLTNTLPW